jgi:dTDP-glucose 4,6-dehydratase
MKHVMVTGGAGFVGSNFIHWLQREEPEAEVVNVDALTYAGTRANLDDLPDQSRHSFIQADINDRTMIENLLVEHEIDTVVHFAAETHVDRSIAGPQAFIHTNVAGTLALLETIRRVWQSPDGRWIDGVRFHHISTDEVFGSLDPFETPFNEKTSYNPRSPYAASKAAADHLVRSFGHTYGLPYTLTNCSNNYGPRQYPEKLVPLVILNALTGFPLPIYGDGQQIRDWLYVDDHCQAIMTVLRQGQIGETYHVGSKVGITNLELVRRICELLDEFRPESTFVPHDQLIQFVTDRPGHDQRYLMDTDKINSQLGWKPQISLEDGLHRTIDWYLENPDWVDAIRAREDYQSWLSDHYGMGDILQ